MHLLLTNDDGFHAPGLNALYHAVQLLGDVTVVAPDTERSASGHAITLSDPIKCRRVEEGDMPGYATSGTPADGVKLALCALLPRPPDLLISGINLGPNTGISVIYSGTVSAATEGTILGIPSIAVSLAAFNEPRWETAAQVIQHVAALVSERRLPPGCLLNVNVPNCPWEQLRGFKLTRMGQSRFIETFDRRQDPRGNIYFWMDGELEWIGDQGGTDLEAVEKGYVSLTPIGTDLTHYTASRHMAETGWLESLPQPGAQPELN